MPGISYAAEIVSVSDIDRDISIGPGSGSRVKGRGIRNLLVNNVNSLAFGNRVGRRSIVSGCNTKGPGAGRSSG